MKKHILLIDSLDKLSLTKDTSLLFAQTLKDCGVLVYLMFEEDFYFLNQESFEFDVYNFTGELSLEPGYLTSFSKSERLKITIDQDVVMHFRLDPPFDTRYLRILWMLNGIKEVTGAKVINDPSSVCQHNEKMIAYESPGALESYVGNSIQGFEKFCLELVKKGHKELILKPLDLFQGIGVEKVLLSEAKKEFIRKCDELGGAVVAQPFMTEVREGEKRSIFFAGKHLGTILKKPTDGGFLTNIAQGAVFAKCDLTSRERLACEKMSKDLMAKGVPWVAYDLLGEKIQEANITCPGLLCEVSFAHDKNLAEDIVKILEES